MNTDKKVRKAILLLLPVFAIVMALSAVYWGSLMALVHPGAACKVLVLEDCDRDFRKPPFEDAIVTFTRRGSPVRMATGLNIAETVGGCRSLSVAGDGRLFTVCENVARQISAYRLGTGARLWTLKGEFSSAIPLTNGMTYALSEGDLSPGTIYGKKLFIINSEGRIVKEAPAAGFDLAMDPNRNAIWLAGKNIKKCDLDLNLIQELNIVGWCAVSIDVARDGSVWVAERQHSEVNGSTNRLIQISQAGQVIRTIGLPFSPLCLRVGRTDDSVWVTGTAVGKSTGQQLLEAAEKRVGRVPTGKRLRDYLVSPRVWARTRKYDRVGVLKCELRQGGFSLDVDQADGSVWIGGKKRVYHYSPRGALMGAYRGLAPDQKYVALAPAGAN